MSVAHTVVTILAAALAVTVVRARRYTHMPFPLVSAAPVAAALALGFAG